MDLQSRIIAFLEETMGDLTVKQQEILDYIVEQQSQKGYPPSVREICEAVGLRSTSTVHGYLSRLEKKGFIRRDPTKPRAIEILDRALQEASLPAAAAEPAPSLPASSVVETVDVPILGKVTAGEPILAVENIEDYFPIPVEYTHNSDVFMLKVRGESMINAGILDGDLILVRAQHTAENKDIVVALLGDSVTVKRFYKENDYIRLQPENDFMDPILVRGCEILGKVIGLFRSIH